MASQAPQASRPRSYREQSTTSSSPARPTKSSEEEFFMLNHSQINTPPENLSETYQSTETTTAPLASANPPPAPREVRECWICREEDIDDTPETSEWRSPCPCSMEAHEACLLEWITDKESPQPGALASTTDIVCPVCKHLYTIERPKDYIVLATDKVVKLAKGFIIPSAISTVVGMVYSGFLIYGINSLQLVFGYDEARMIMAPTRQDMERNLRMRSQPLHRSFTRLVKLMDPFLPGTDSIANWRLFVGLPLIVPTLVLSRTRIADPLFAFMPVVYFVTRTDIRELKDWPPSPAVTFATLPYIRSAYNQLYRVVFGELEKNWDKAVQRTPREGETADGIQAANQAANEAENHIFDLQLEIIEEVVADEDEIPALAQEPQEAEAEGEGAAQAEAPQAGAAVPPAPPQRQNNWEIHQNISTAQALTSVMGALFLPTISSIMGDILRLTLPTRWVGKSSQRSFWKPTQPQGLLHAKWGRSVVGGCLFVVLKDAIILYCKWKKARDFGKRKIVDYKKK